MSFPEPCTFPCLNGGECVHPASCNCSQYEATGVRCQTVPNKGFERELICRTWGQYNYETFDGLYYYFPGKCTYTLVRECDDAVQPSFMIQVHNDPTCHSSTYQCARSVSLFLPGDGELRLQKYNITFRGQSIQPPHSVHDVEIERISQYILVTQQHGFTLAWDGIKASVYLKMSPEYVGRTCGLCGNFNADVQDDLKTSFGLLTHDVALFGNSWMETEPLQQMCSTVPADYTSPCSSHDPRAQQNMHEWCGLLLKPPFKYCHEFVSPFPFMASCFNDLCITGPNANDEVLCQTLAEYARACAHSDHPLHDWRAQIPQCAVECDDKFVYRECITCCPVSCSIDKMCIDSKLQCLDGCYCPEDLIYDNGSCVQPSECPCDYHGMVFSPGHIVQEECNNCTCVGGYWNCTDHRCPGECSVTGDIHFQTLDGQVYTFQATCQYVLAKSRTSGKFTVTIQNAPCGVNLDGACIQSVSLVVDEDPRKEITVTHNGEVYVFSQYRIALPFTDDTFLIQELSSMFIQIKTMDGLRLQYNWKEARLYLQLDEVWKEDTIGLCGTFNGNILDDFLSPAGMIESTPQLFGNSWKLSSACVPGHSIPQLDPCDIHQQAASYAVEKCEILNQELFSRCHEYLSPVPFHQQCKSDTCKCGKMCLCGVLAHYARQCRKYGVIIDFRAHISECTVQCPETMVYGSCVSSCPQRCPSLVTPEHCGEECEEGCACPPGTYYSSKALRCVQKNECSCSFLGVEYAPGDIIMTSSGMQVCKDGRMISQSSSTEKSCPSGQLYVGCRDSLDGTALSEGTACEQTCESYLLNLTCSGHEPCVSGCVCPPGLLKHGDECFEPAACPCLWKGKEYYPGDKVMSPCHSCVCQHGSFQCDFHPCPSMCTAYGDRHYRTFDGLLFDYVGACKVYLLKSGIDLTMTITAENVDCYDSGVICRKSLLINVGKSFIVFDNDSGKPNPSSLIDKHQNVFIWQAGYFTIVHAPDEDITVLWDRRTTIHIQAGPRWQGKLSGLCGNFDMKTVNEMRTPENIDSATPQEFGNSWTAAECVNSPDIRHPCSLSPLREPFAKRECGILLSEVFQVCHHVVDVTWFYMNCLTDTCSCNRGGDCECFCTSVSAYAHRCCQQGISVDWRSPNLCPYDCEFYNKVLGKGPFTLVTYKEKDTVLAANLSGGSVFPEKGVTTVPGLTRYFMMTPGLSRARPHDTSLVSFEAAERPNYFLRLDPSGHLHLTKWEESDRFQDETTFVIHRNTWISGYDSLESYIKPGFFLHYMLSWFHLMKYNHSAGFREATLFKLTGQSSSHSPCQWRYESCASACFKTCSDPTGQTCASIPKVEGCLPQCPHDMVLDEVTQRCVHLVDCIKPTVAIEPITPYSTVSPPAAVTSASINATGSPGSSLSTAHSVSHTDTLTQLSTAETKSTLRTPGITSQTALPSATATALNFTGHEAELTSSSAVFNLTTTATELSVSTAGPAVLESVTTEKTSEISTMRLISTSIFKTRPSSLYTKSTERTSTESTMAPFWLSTTSTAPATSKRTTASFTALTDSKLPATVAWSSGPKETISLPTTLSLPSKATDLTLATSKVTVPPMYTTTTIQADTSNVTEATTVTTGPMTMSNETTTRLVEVTSSPHATQPKTPESTVHSSPAETVKTTEAPTPEVKSPITPGTTSLSPETDTRLTSSSTAHASPLTTLKIISPITQKTKQPHTPMITSKVTEHPLTTEMKTSKTHGALYTSSTAPVSTLSWGTTSLGAIQHSSVSPFSTVTGETTSVFFTAPGASTKTTAHPLAGLTTSATAKMSTPKLEGTTQMDQPTTIASTEKTTSFTGAPTTKSTTPVLTKESLRTSTKTMHTELQKTTLQTYPTDKIDTTSQTSVFPPSSIEVTHTTLQPIKTAMTFTPLTTRITTPIHRTHTSSATPSYSSSAEYTLKTTTTQPSLSAISHLSTIQTTTYLESTVTPGSLSQLTTLRTTVLYQSPSTTTSSKPPFSTTVSAMSPATSVKPSVFTLQTTSLPTSQPLLQPTSETSALPYTSQSTVHKTPLPESKPYSYSSATTETKAPLIFTTTQKASTTPFTSQRTTVQLFGKSTTSRFLETTSTLVGTPSVVVSSATSMVSTSPSVSSLSQVAPSTTGRTTVSTEKMPTMTRATKTTFPTQRSTLGTTLAETTQFSMSTGALQETSSETTTMKIFTERVTESSSIAPLSWGTATTSLRSSAIPTAVSTPAQPTEKLTQATTPTQTLTTVASSEPSHPSAIVTPKSTEQPLVSVTSESQTTQQAVSTSMSKSTEALMTEKTSAVANLTGTAESLKTTSYAHLLTSKGFLGTGIPTSGMLITSSPQVTTTGQTTASIIASTSKLSLTSTAPSTNKTEYWSTQTREPGTTTEDTGTPSVLPQTTDHTTVAVSTKMCTPPYSEIIDECTKYVCMNGQLMLFNKSQNCPNNAIPPNCGLLGFAVLVNGDKCCPQWDCPCRCSVFPDLNVITFDGNSVAIYKAASYIVTQLPNETVSIQVQECQSSDTVLWNFTNLCLVALNITHKSHQVLINRLQRRLYVNSRYARPRFKKHGFEVLDTGNMYLIRTPTGLKIQWFHSTGMMIIETETSSNKLSTMGLCGCCDGDPTNDLTMSNGTAVAESEDPTLFIDSWQVPNTTSFMGQNRRREVNCSTSDCSACLAMLSNHTFSVCHSFVPPSVFCEVWVRDAEYVKSPCIALAAYVAACHKYNICIEWRSPDYCSFMCPPELRYQACLPACTAQTCPSHESDSDPEECSGLTEGCVCPDETVLHRPYSALCIPSEKCACTDSFGTPRASGEVWRASKDGCCMYKCDNDSIIPVEYDCTDIPGPVCKKTGEVIVSLADDKSCCPQKACVCNHTLCSHDTPGCKYGERLVSYYREDSCCPEYTCECDPDRCESDIPTCREDQTLIATRADGSCCMAYICMCGTCTDTIPACQQGEVFTVDANSTDRCCPEYQCMCEPYRCPPFTCPLGMSVVTVWTPERCCPLNTCECACDTIPKPKCALGETMQIDTQFLADPENQCGCTEYKCERESVCVDGERGVMRPGQTLVEHTSEGICYTTQCTYSLDPLTQYYRIRASSTNCSAQCQPNQVYLPPKDLTTCCGVCKNISCIYHMDNGSVALYKPGKTWVSNCMKYDCSDTLSGPTLITYSISCPPFNETECMKIGGTVVSYMDGCCKSCTGFSLFPFPVRPVPPTVSTNCDKGKEDGKSCQKVTVRMTIRKNDCRSNRPVNIVSCDGKCPSASIYNYNINTYARFCKCCREIGLQRRSVQLYCSGNSTWVYYSIQEPTDCSCQWS
ncbi:otogelin [Lepisosteus oculatus]|uniref:otogelin n=1 Tax=Lepisosteus oculatus TaxID=7918 RepID=UPI0035F51D9B